MMIPLHGTVQHYDWGGYDFIPQWLQVANPEKQPWAEYWLGSHPRGESRLQLDGHEVLLKDWLAEAPEHRLGAATAREFGPQLPYLFKILDVRAMLSIQCHPNREQARAGFAREEAAGIPRTAPHRNYRDPNPKPELMVALSDFWLLHGFGREADICERLREREALAPLAIELAELGLRAFYKHWMSLPQDTTDERLRALAEELLPQMRSGDLTTDHPDYWAARALQQFTPAAGRYDRGVLSIYLMNLVRLAPGQGIFQAPGILHAYLKGQNVELMANSDNVLRGGLTRKHIDIPELLRNLDFEPVAPQILKGRRGQAGEQLFELPVPDFALGHIQLRSGQDFDWKAEGLEILLVRKGAVEERETQKTFGQGSAMALPAGRPGRIRALEASALFRAYCPIGS
jgi:mannose-6-phosphate isomerase